MVNCPYCGKLTDPKLDNCPHCSANLQKPSAPGPRNNRNRQTCPNCKAMVQEGDIICVVCGTNLLTGQKIAEETKARGRSDRTTPLLILGAVAAAVLIIAAGFWVYFASRDPLTQAMGLIEEQRFLDAQDALEEYVQQVPNNERALFELGRLQWRHNLYAQAASTFEQLVEVNPTRTDAALWAVACLELAGGPSARDRQVVMLERVVDLEPDNAQVWYLLALARATQGNAGGQIEALERVLALGKLEGPARQALGVAHALRGEFARADQELDAAGALGTNSDLTALRGFVAAIEGDKQEATEQLLAAASGQDLTVRWEALTQLGKIMIEQGRYADATRYLEEAMALRSNDDLARYLHSISLQATGYTQDALTGYEAIMRDRGQYAHQAAVQAADIYLRLGNLDRARQAIADASEVGQKGAPYYTVQGRTLAMAGDAASAQTAFRQAMNADPGYAPAFLESGLLFVKGEALEQGLRELETYLQYVGPDATSPEVQQIRELTNQLRQTIQDSANA